MKRKKNKEPDTHLHWNEKGYIVKSKKYNNDINELHTRILVDVRQYDIQKADWTLHCT